MENKLEEEERKTGGSVIQHSQEELPTDCSSRAAAERMERGVWTRKVKIGE